ncbi:10327_t:CDS:2 [Entrophospora sp. SA101]|nr:10327_t:CDS:2 [Entrophospora sp. SA101]
MLLLRESETELPKIGKEENYPRISSRESQDADQIRKNTKNFLSSNVTNNTMLANSNNNKKIGRGFTCLTNGRNSNYVYSHFSNVINQNFRSSTSATNNRNHNYYTQYSYHLVPIKRCKGVCAMIFDNFSFLRHNINNINSSKSNRKHNTISVTPNSNSISSSDISVNSIGSSGTIDQNKPLQQHQLNFSNFDMTFSSTKEFNDYILILIEKNPQILSNVEKIYSKINSYGIIPNATTYNILLEAIGNLKKEPLSMSKMMNYYNKMIESHIVPSHYTFSILIRHLGKRYREFDYQKIFWTMRLKLKPDDKYASQCIENIRVEENNLNLALVMLNDAFRTKAIKYDTDLYDWLLCSIAYGGKIEDALNVFENMEKNRVVSPLTYGYLVRLYGRVGDIECALECYQEYVKKLPSYYKNMVQNPLAIYNHLIYAYVNCNDFNGAANVMDNLIPRNNLKPNDSTYYTIIKSLCEKGEIKLAEKYFNKFNVQLQHTSSPLLLNIRAKIYSTLVAHYSTTPGYYSKATELFNNVMGREDLRIDSAALNVYIYATIKYQIDKLNELVESLLNSGRVFDDYLTKDIIMHYSEVESPSKTLNIMARILFNYQKSINGIERFYHYKELFAYLLNNSDVSLNEAIDFKLKFYYCSFDISPIVNEILIKKYIALKKQSKHFSRLKSLSETQISGLFDSFGFKLRDDNKNESINDHINGLLELMDDFVATGVMVPYHTIEKYSDPLKEFGDEEAIKKWNELCLTMTKMYDINKKDNDDVVVEADKKDKSGEILMMERNPTTEEINRSSELASICRGNDIKPGVILTGIKQILDDNLLPTPELVSQAIRNLGKQNKLEEALEIYKLFLTFYTQWNKQVREKALYYIYNSVLIAYASNDKADEAFKVHDEMIKKCWHPDADAYADLLVVEKEADPYDITTVLSIYSEIIKFKIRPTIYLCNVLISKFGKALWVDLAQKIYDDMEINQIQPTVITYGALLSAYTKAKYEEKALELFRQIENKADIRLRIGQYNTMMQYYIADVPSKEKVLEFYHKSQQRNLEPNSHTYKILIDMHATIEPYDMKSALNVLEEMKQKDVIVPKATHYASLIYAYGYCQKDLKSALEVFHSLESTHSIAPDVEIFKALLDALLGNGKIKEAEEYYNMISNEANIKSSSIDNLFIKSYGKLGQLEKAEKLFNSMSDISREPGTYEEMITAYISNGNIEKAKGIVHILKNKNYSNIIKNNINNLLRS